MRRNPAEVIVEFLSFSSDSCHGANEQQKFSVREWERALKWLDDSGLAFYFLQKLKNTSLIDTVPTRVTSRLERNFQANKLRVDDMAHRFGLINHKFNQAGVRYAALKGVSIVPQFCPDATLRHQADFDYLVADQSLSEARQVLVEAGYIPTASHSSQEFGFVMAGTEEPSRTAEQYSARAPHAVELHLDPWDSSQNRLPLMPKQFSLQRTTTREWNGLTFPALTDDDAFLLQVLHACKHLFTYWIRMSSLFEIGYFLNQRASDASLWNRIEERVGNNVILREFVVVITELVAKLFGSPLPPLVGAWSATIRPATRVWIDRYARDWVFGELPVYEFCLFPPAKLVLFLHQQYEYACAQNHVIRNRMMNFPRLSAMASSVRNSPSLALNPAWWKRHLLIRRSLFHTLAALRYVCEIPRWRWLNRASIRSAALDLQFNRDRH